MGQVWDSALSRNLNHEHPAGYAELYEDNDSGDSITITTAGTYYKWLLGTKGDCSDSLITTTAGGTDNNFTIKAGGDGVYLLTFTISFSAGNTANTYHWHVHKNGVKLAHAGSQTKNPSATTTTKTIAVVAIEKLVKGDVIDLRVTSTGSSDSVTVYHCNLSIAMITPFLPS